MRVPDSSSPPPPTPVRLYPEARTRPAPSTADVGDAVIPPAAESQLRSARGTSSERGALAGGGAALVSYAATMQTLLDAVERAGVGEVIDSLRNLAWWVGAVDEGRVRPHSLRQAIYRFAVILHATMVRAERGERPDFGPPRGCPVDAQTLYRWTLQRLEAGSFDFDAAADALDADSIWQGSSVWILEDGQRRRLDRDTTRSWSEGAVADVVAPGRQTRTIVERFEFQALLGVAANAAEGRFTPAERDLLAARTLDRNGGDWMRMSSEVMPALVALTEVDPLTWSEVPPGSTLVAREGQTTIDTVAMPGGRLIRVEAKSFEALAEEIQAKLDTGQLAAVHPDVRRVIDQILAGPVDPSGRALLARVDEAASSTAWRAFATDAVKVAVLSAASWGVGAAVGSGLGALAGGGARGLQAAGWAGLAATSGSFTTLASLEDGQWSAARYATDLALFKVLSITGRIAQRLAHVVPGDRAAARLTRFAIARGLSGASTAGVLTAVDGAARAAAGDRPEWQALARGFQRHLGLVTLLGTIHAGLAAADRRGRRTSRGTAAPASTKLEAESKALIGRLQQHFQAQLEAIEQGDLRRAVRAESSVAEALAVVPDLVQRMEAFTQAHHPAQASALRQGLQAAEEVWRFTRTPGMVSEGKVEAARARARQGQLGAPIPDPEGVLMRLQDGWRDCPHQTEWAWSMSVEIESTVGLIRAGRLRHIDAVLDRGSEMARGPSRFSERRDLGVASKRAFGRRRAAGFHSTTPSPSYPGYHEALAKTFERAPIEGRTSHPEGLSLTRGRALGEHGAWTHTNPEGFAPLEGRVERAWQRGLDARSYVDLIDAAAEFHWWGVQMMPFERGSAGAIDGLTRALLRAGGRAGRFSVEPGAWREGVAPDLEAYHLSVPEFVRRYPSFFEPSSAERVITPSRSTPTIEPKAQRR